LGDPGCALREVPDPTEACSALALSGCALREVPDPSEACSGLALSDCAGTIGSESAVLAWVMWVILVGLAAAGFWLWFLAGKAVPSVTRIRIWFPSPCE
jgi:hypothetical protein